MKKKKIYAFNNGGRPGFYEAVAVGEDGLCLASHICSDERWMLHDMGVTSDWKHDTYDAWAPEGWEIEFIPSEELDTHEDLKKAITLAEEKGYPEFEAAEKASISVTMSKD